MPSHPLHQVLLLEDSGDPVAADITDDRLAIRLPNAPDDGDNFVTGLGVDLTAGVQVEVSHPTDPEAGDLGPQPLLWVSGGGWHRAPVRGLGLARWGRLGACFSCKVGRMPG